MQLVPTQNALEGLCEEKRQIKPGLVPEES